VAEGFGIQGAAAGVQSNLSGVTSGSQAADAAANLPQAPTSDAQVTQQTSVTQSTSYVSEPAIVAPAHSKVVARLLEQNATVFGPGLARVPLPARPDGTPRTQPKKPAGPMVAPRSLEAGRSPLAPVSLFDARASIDALGELPSGGHDVNAYWSGRLDALDAFLEGSA
jgi:hypothetical protein